MTDLAEEGASFGKALAPVIDDGGSGKCEVALLAAAM
jgi:hypothetical protein